jgi:hypothetical protein
MTLTYKEYLAKPRSFRDQWERMLEVIARMRTFGDSLPSASRAFGIREETVLRLGGSALKRLPDGCYVARPTDTLLWIAFLPSYRGLREVALRGSREASLIVDYWNAVDFFFSTGSVAALRSLRRKWLIAGDGKRIQLLTDAKELRRYGQAGKRKAPR